MSISQLDPTTYYLGRQFGNYRLVRLLGQGGFAAVYLGRHIYLGTLAAVKILHTRPTDVDVRKFYVEARIAARLRHPHIIRVLEFGLEDETPFLVMDYAPRGTLRQRYPRGSRLDPQVVIEYVRQIADAVQSIHDKGLIHRDIKPENLLLGRNNELLLSDFGITIAAHKAAAGEEVTVGTIAYMAPEQIEGYPCLASDQYALAVVVYEWLCGALPFRGSSQRIAHQHLHASPPSLCERVPTLPRAVEDMLFKALAKEPEQRFENVQAFALALEEAFEAKPDSNVDHPSSAPGRPPAGEPARTGGNMKSRSAWKEISTLFSLDLLMGAALTIALFALGVAPQLLWSLVALCVVVFPLVGALIRRSQAAFFLTLSIAIVAAGPGMIFHDFMPFVAPYAILLLLSLITALTASVNGF